MEGSQSSSVPEAEASICTINDEAAQEVVQDSEVIVLCSTVSNSIEVV